MTNYKLMNNVTGWIVFLIATGVFMSTCEPTASFWDCGEYIATSYKLMVGHPPGAPTFQLLGRFFSLFAFGNVAKVAIMVNYMSAIASGFAVLFLFWTITAFAKKIAVKSSELTQAKIFAILGSGAVGALAYCFSDSFWFSAVEGEVYATSAFFTAIVFWCMLKWEDVADSKYASRWLILIAFLVGLSIGVHLLNLLCIPAMAYIYYYKKYKPTRKGFFIVGIIGVFILGLVQAIIIPGIVSMFAKFELLFVNGIGLPFNTGTVIFALLLLSGIVWGLWYSKKRGKPIINTAVLAFAFLVIGYSTFIVLVVRSQAKPPINENSPDNAINMLAYLNREQYGDWPIAYGQYYNAPLDKENPYKDGTPVYAKDEKAGKYIISDERKNSIPNYDPAFCTIFPRMWETQQEDHKKKYIEWAEIKGEPVKTAGRDGKEEIIYKPTFGENLKFFFRYQAGWMYLRYFFWNYVGRQNDTQGHGNITDGNWISGINFIDEARLGKQDNLPDAFKNKGTNKYYFLPLLLGIIGVVFHFKKDNKDAFIILLLFVLTGLAINIYLNPYPLQPRERDYAYAGSTYAYAMWIGLGVYALFEFLSKKAPALVSAVLISLACLILVPGIMANQNWDDHDRSNRYTCLDFASNYLNSCQKNAIIFTNGDNDTFPLWYAQEVEGVRRDVRVVNLSLLNTDWYVDQMRRKAYESDAVPINMTKEQYRQGTRDVVYFIDNPEITGYVDLKQAMDFVKSSDPQTKFETSRGRVDYFPTHKFKLPVDSATVVSNGTVPRNLAGKVVKSIEWELKGWGIQKNHLMVLEMLANNNWKRPVYFAITTGGENYLGLEKYFHLEGLAYRLVPVADTVNDGQTGMVNTNEMYNNMMNKFKWGNMMDKKVYMDETNMRMTMNFRNNFARLAESLIREGKKDKALKALDKCMEVMPKEAVPYNFFMLPLVDMYYKLDKTDKANAIVKELADIYNKELTYYFSLDHQRAQTIDDEKQRDLYVMQRLVYITKQNKQDKLNKEIDAQFQGFYKMYMGSNPQMAPNMQAPQEQAGQEQSQE